MNFSRREQLILMAAAAVISLLVLDRYVVTPFLDSWEQVTAEKRRLQQELATAGNLFDRRRRMQERWAEILDSRLESDPARAESQVLSALHGWSQNTGLRLSSLKPEHSREKDELRRVSFQLSGTGHMRSVVGFLWNVETSPLPLKVTELQLSTPGEGRELLTLQLRVSTVYVPGQENENDRAAVGPAADAANGGA